MSVPSLVSEELWQDAQKALARNRVIAKNTPRHYLLTGLIKCGICGKSYCATHGRDTILWWRCNGRMLQRYPENRCQSKGVKGTELEAIIWGDIEQWLENPGDLINELEVESNGEKSVAVEEAERTALEVRLAVLDNERKGYLRQNAQGLIGDADLREFIGKIAEKKTEIEHRLQELKPKEREDQGVFPMDKLQELRRRLNEGLTEEQRQEIAYLLVRKITMKTEIEDKTRRCIAIVEYRFPSGAVNSDSGTDSSLPPT